MYIDKYIAVQKQYTDLIDMDRERAYMCKKYKIQFILSLLSKMKVKNQNKPNFHKQCTNYVKY